MAFLDDDDVWLPLKLEKQVALMENNESLGLVYCNSVSVNERDECIAQTSGTTRGAVHEHLLAANCLGPPSGVMVRDRVFAKAGYFDENLSALEDWDLWIRLTQWFAVDVVEQPLLKYRVHSSNMSNNLDRMEHATFSVLNKYWPAGDGEGPGGGRRNEVYSNHCVNFAWKRYALGQREAFRKLLLQALAYDPCHQIVIRGDGLEHKEEAHGDSMIRTVFVMACALAGCTASTSPLDPLLKTDAPTLAPQPSTQPTAVVQSIAGINQANWWPDFSGVGNSSKGCMRSLQAGRFALPLPLVEGGGVPSLTVAMVGDGTVNVDVDPLSVRPDGSLVVGVLGSIAALQVPSVWTDYTIDLVDTTVAVGAAHWFEVAATASGACVGAFRLTYDHP